MDRLLMLVAVGLVIADGGGIGTPDAGLGEGQGYEAFIEAASGQTTGDRPAKFCYWSLPKIGCITGSQPGLEDRLAGFYGAAIRRSSALHGP